MKYRMRRDRLPLILWCVSLMMVLTACNLNTSPQSNEEVPIEQETNITQPQATRTVQAGVSVPTGLPTLTPIPFATQIPPTRVVIAPPIAARPTSTSLPFSIVIVSPSPGNVVSGNVQVVGSAIHPDFLQYRLEFGPDPNPSNLYFPITGIVQSPILASSLGVWNTTAPGTPDGVYQLRLRVFLRDGSIQTTSVGGIRVRNQQPTPIPTNTPTIPRPIASFTQDRTTGEAPLVVRFSDRSQGQISSYSWAFGDGGSSSSRNPTYTYASPGVYTVTLRVQGPGGSANVSNQIAVQSPDAPEAAFTPSVVSGEAPLVVNFTNTSTGQIDSVEWDFGDGDTSTQSNVSHTFSAPNTYNVILRVGGPGGSDVVVQPITVENPSIPPPIANFEVDTVSGETPLTVNFTNTTTGEVTQYLWDFDGDGITDNTNVDPTHVYAAAGTYNVRLLAIGEGGQDEAPIVTITVQDPPDAPVASFTVSTDVGEAPLTVDFTNTTTGDATAYVWDFDGDDQPDSTEVNPQFTYQSPGTYSVSLIANGDGGSTTTSSVITVQQPPEPPTAAFNTDTTAGQAPLLVQFTNQSEGTQLTYAWDFDGDGNIDSTDPDPAFEYTIPGNYTVTLTITDPNNLSATATETINVSEAVVQQPPTAAFTSDVASGTAPLTVNFTNQSLGDVTAYEWDFQSDGAVDSTDPNPMFEFAASGDYTVSLTVIGPGGSDTISSVISVSEALSVPVPAISADVTQGTAPLTVNFSAAGSSGVIDTYEWDFQSDGAVDSTEPNPSFEFGTAGDYVVTLTVGNAAGRDSISQTINVSEPLPEVTEIPEVTEPATPVLPTGAIAFTSDRDGNNEIYVVETDGTNAVNITNNLANDQQPAWSPDGAQLAFVSDRDGNNEIYVLRLSDLAVTRLTDNAANDQQSAWSPDGTQLAFVSDRTGNNDIFVMAADGTNPSQVTVEPNNDVQPDWSVTGLIVFTSDRFGDDDVFLILPGDINTLQQLTSATSDDQYPAWSPDGTQVLFTSNRALDGSNAIIDNNLFFMSADGSNPVPFITDASSDIDADWR